MLAPTLSVRPNSSEAVVGPGATSARPVHSPGAPRSSPRLAEPKSTRRWKFSEATGVAQSSMAALSRPERMPLGRSR